MAKKEASTETTSPRFIRLTDGTFDALNARRYETTLDDLGAGDAREGDDAVALDAFSEPTQRARPPLKRHDFRNEAKEGGERNGKLGQRKYENHGNAQWYNQVLASIYQCK